MSIAASEFLTPYQLHQRWGRAISPKTLANWRTRGQGPEWTKLGGRVVYPLHLVVAYEQAGKPTRELVKATGC